MNFLFNLHILSYTSWTILHSRTMDHFTETTLHSMKWRLDCIALVHQKLAVDLLNTD